MASSAQSWGPLNFSSPSTHRIVIHSRTEHRGPRFTLYTHSCYMDLNHVAIKIWSILEVCELSTSFFRSGGTFKLKLRLPVSELWLQNSVDGVSESSVSTNKSFVIGWPTISYVATFRYVFLSIVKKCVLCLLIFSSTFLQYFVKHLVWSCL